MGLMERIAQAINGNQPNTQTGTGFRYGVPQPEPGKPMPVPNVRYLRRPEHGDQDAKHDCDLPPANADAEGAVVKCRQCLRVWRCRTYTERVQRGRPVAQFEMRYPNGDHAVRRWTWKRCGWFLSWWYETVDDMGW